MLLNRSRTSEFVAVWLPLLCIFAFVAVVLLAWAEPSQGAPSSVELEGDHPTPGPAVWCVEVAGPSRWEGVYAQTPAPVWDGKRRAYAVWVGGPDRPPAYFPGSWLCSFWRD